MSRSRRLTAAQAQETLAAANLGRCWEIFTAQPTGTDLPAGYEETVIRDIVYKLIQYGAISDRQTAFLGKLLAQLDGRPARAAAKAATPRWTEGRQEIEGEIMSTKWYEGGRFGDYQGMTVKLDDGRAIWMRMPAGLYTYRATPDRGQRVRVSVEVLPKRDDPTFAMGKRPTKAAMVGVEAVGAPAPTGVEVTAAAPVAEVTASAALTPYLAALAGQPEALAA